MNSEETQNSIIHNSEQCSSILLQEGTPQSPPIELVQDSLYNLTICLPHIINENLTLKEDKKRLSEEIKQLKDENNNLRKENNEYRNAILYGVNPIIQTPNNTKMTEEMICDTTNFKSMKDMLILKNNILKLIKSRMAENKWIIESVRDILPIYKVVSKRIFFGTLKNFCEFYISSVVPEIEDEDRRKKLSGNYNDLKNANDLVKKTEPKDWRKELQDNPKSESLARAVNIMDRLMLMYPILEHYLK